MENMTVETSLKGIDVYRDELPGKRKGHVDVRVRLIRYFNPEDEEDVVTVNIIRVYFTSEEVTVKELIDSAFRRAHQAVIQLAAQCGSVPGSADPGPLWIE